MRLATFALGSSLLATACAAPAAKHVPTAFAPIDIHAPGRHHSGYSEKLGVTIDGDLCGEEYVHAVDGVPEAEREVARCRSFAPLAAATGYVAVAGFLGGIVSVVTAGAGAPVGVCLSIFASSLGVVAASQSMNAPALRHWGAAVRLYNAEVYRRGACGVKGCR